MSNAADLRKPETASSVLRGQAPLTRMPGLLINIKVWALVLDEDPVTTWAMLEER
jgi:hypothetical protein